MLEKFERIKVSNNGSKRVFSLEPIFINVNKIISVLDTDQMLEVLKVEDSNLCEKSFSILSWTHGDTVKESIVVGSAESIYCALSNSELNNRQLLNG